MDGIIGSGLLRGALDCDEAIAWCYRFSAGLLMLYPGALLLWTIIEGRQMALRQQQKSLLKRLALSADDKCLAAAELATPSGPKKPAAGRRRARLLPAALLAAAAGAAALVGAAAFGFAVGAEADGARPKRGAGGTARAAAAVAVAAPAGTATLQHGVPPAGALLESTLAGVPGRADKAHWLQHTAPHTARAAEASTDELPNLTPAELLQLQRGQEVRRQEHKGGRGWGLFVVDVRAPPGVVFNCLQSFESYPRMIPSVRRAEVRARVNTGKGAFSARANYKVSRFGLGLSVVHAVDPAAGTVKFDLDEACAELVLQEAHGAWRVEQAPGGNRNKSRVWLRIRLSASRLLPRWLVDYAAERALWRATFWLKPFMEQLGQKEQRCSPLPQQLVPARGQLRFSRA